jgi:hypothetical protein
MIINFWENVLRYPRFFISIIIGLFSIIISPIIYFLNKSNNLLIKILFLIGLIILIILLLTNIIEY